MPPHAPGQGRRYGHRLAVLAVAALALVGLNVSAAHAAPAYSRGVQASAPAAPIVASTNYKSCVAYIGTGYVRVTASIAQSFRSGYSSVHVTVTNHAGRAASMATFHVGDALTVYRGPGGWRPNGESWEWTAPEVKTWSGLVFVAVYSTTNPYQNDSCGFGTL